METTRLFDPQRVSKFFSILQKMGRMCNTLYKGHDKLNPDSVPCDKEIFVNRTIAKWFKGKHVIIYAVENDFQFKQYIVINGLRYGLGYSDYITIYYYDMARPSCLFNMMKLDHNGCLTMEGRWCDNSSEHLKLFQMFVIDLPKKEYVFKYYDISKPKKGAKLEDYASTKSFIARTEYDANKQRKEWTDKDKYLGELIEVKSYGQ